MKDYTTMSLKELEKEHAKQEQILLDMINGINYSKQDIESQRSLVEEIYKMIGKKNRKISKMKG